MTPQQAENVHDEAHRRMKEEHDRRNANLKREREQYYTSGPKKTTRRPQS